MSWRKAISDYLFLILLFCFFLWANIEKRETILTCLHLLISVLISRKRRLRFYSFNLFSLPLFLACKMTNSIYKWLRCSSLNKKNWSTSFQGKGASWCREENAEGQPGTDKLKLVCMQYLFIYLLSFWWWAAGEQKFFKGVSFETLFGGCLEFESNLTRTLSRHRLRLRLRFQKLIWRYNYNSEACSKEIWRAQKLFIESLRPVLGASFVHISDKKCFEDAIFFNALFESAIFLREQFFMEEQFFFSRS